MDIQLYLPWPPTVNSYYGKRGNIVYIKKAGKLFREQVEDDLAVQLPSGFSPIDERMRIGLIFYPPDRRRRDLDNYKKALFDALTLYGLWDDDSLIDQDYSYRGEPVKGGRIALKIDYAGPIIPFSTDSAWDFTDF